MTIVVFNSGILTVSTPSWCATELTEASKPLVQVHVLGSPAVAQCNLEMGMAEFVALVAEGGKVVDLRGIQEPPRKSKAQYALEARARAAQRFIDEHGM